MCRNRAIAFLILMVIVFSLTACAKLSSRVTPNTDLNQYETYFVVRHARDIRLIDQIIRNEMIILGLKAQSGTIGQKLPGIDVIVTYEDRWAWDMTTYMLSLTIDFRDARNNVLLATGQSYRPSLERKSPQEMAREVLESIMGKANVSIKAVAIPTAMAAVPKETSIIEVSLREKPIDKLSEDDINEMIVKYGFFEASNQSSASFSNTLVDSGVGTVSDKTTGLMWQKGGSLKSLNHASAKKYIESQNANSFAGYSNWRIPTVDELASLLEKDKTNGVHLNPIFDKYQYRCWSADGAPGMHRYTNEKTVWIIDYRSGEAKRANWYERQRGMKSYTVFPDNYVKAVRSVNK